MAAGEQIEDPPIDQAQVWAGPPLTIFYSEYKVRINFFYGINWEFFSIWGGLPNSQNLFIYTKNSS